VSLLTDLGLEVPLTGAPMAGGPSTPALVQAAAGAGALGFLAAGYRTAEQLAEQIDEVRSGVAPAARGTSFGVNVFAPNPLPVDPGAFRRYARALQADADAYGIDLTASTAIEDDDHWQDKIDLLLAHPVPVVTFTFGIPAPGLIADLRRAGTVVGQTVTSVGEAQQAAGAGVDLLVVQASEAGGHSGTLTPQQPPEAVPLLDLIGQIRHLVPMPVLAAGGLVTPEAVAAVVRAGALAAVVGTALLLADEAGTSPAYRSALAAASPGRTTITRAFSGRPARGLRNRFTDAHDGEAPFGYPAIHHLTSPLRRAASGAGDPELINLWAGTGYRHATAEPAAYILGRLATGL
jgi:nitronate monooxygenase